MHTCIRKAQNVLEHGFQNSNLNCICFFTRIVVVYTYYSSLLCQYFYYFSHCIGTWRFESKMVYINRFGLTLVKLSG